MPDWTGALTNISMPKSIITAFFDDLRSVSARDRVYVLFWILGPLIYLVERTPADAWLVLIGLGFLFHSAVTSSWQWVKTGWVKLFLGFWLIMLTMSALSTNPSYALGEAIAWIRFPLYAAACAFWIGTNRARLNMMMLMMTIGTIIMMAILSVEFVDVVQHGNTEGGRLGGPYGDLVPGSFLGKAMLPLAVVMSALAMSLPIRLSLLPLLLTGCLVLFTIFTGERINSLLIALAVFLAAFTWKFDLRRTLFFGVMAATLLFAAIQNIPALSDRYDLARHSETSNYFDSPYWFSVRPGIVAAIKNPITGIGVGMHRLECATISHGPDWLPGINNCHPHPHQFYVQIAEETGLLGLLAGLAAIGALVRATIINTHRSSLYARLAWIPVTMVFFPQPSADFFGQWNNLFLWFAVGLAMAMARDTHSDR